MAALRAMMHGLLHAARAQLRRAVLLLDVDEDGEPRARGGGAGPVAATAATIAATTTATTAVAPTTATPGAPTAATPTAAAPTAPPGATTWPAIQWDRLVDNAAETRAGWNFAEDPRNREAFGGIDGKRWLADRVVAEPWLRQQFFMTEPEPRQRHTSNNTTNNTTSSSRSSSGANGTQWRIERVHQYGEAMAAFRAQLLVLMHMSGGQPARGTELVTVQYKNGTEGDIRGLFIEDGMVVFVTMYSKTMGMSAKAKVIHRYLPREVGELVVYYVWLAIPFWRLVVQGASGGTADWGSPYIWEPRPEEAWAFPGQEGGEGAAGARGRREDRVGKRRRRSVGAGHDMAARKRRRQAGSPTPPPPPHQNGNGNSDTMTVEAVDMFEEEASDREAGAGAGQWYQGKSRAEAAQEQETWW
ncbi:hypothetical protein C7999DRAFT_36735, partial [Corynascus novoguineensis]